MASIPFSTSKTLISLIIRTLQLAFAIICLGLAAGVVHDLDYGPSEINFILATSVLTFIYLVGVFIVPLVVIVPLLFFFVWEIVMMVFWLTSFAVAANDFGNCATSYTGFRFSYTFKYCKIGKALIPFALFNWLLFAASLTLFVLFVLVPHTRSTSFLDFARTFRNDLTLGAIFSSRIPLPASTAPVVGEREVGIASTDEEPKGPEPAVGSGPAVAEATAPETEEVPEPTIGETHATEDKAPEVGDVRLA